MTHKHALSIPGLETVYDTLAVGIDRAGPEKVELFLVKLALLNANVLNDPILFESQVKTALLNL